MTFPGRPFKTIMSRAFHRRHAGKTPQVTTDDKLDSLATTELSDQEVETEINTADVFVSHAGEEPSEDASTTTESPFKQITLDKIEAGEESEEEEPEPASQYSEITDATPISDIFQKPSMPQEEPAAELAVEPAATPEQTEVVADSSWLAPPPPLSVDNMIANSLGNIFQKRVVKDPTMKALLDRHPDVDMRSLANELRKFSEDIGASEKRD